MTAAGMFAAGVAVGMMVVITVEVISDRERTGEEIFCSFPDIALCSADNFDPCIAQSIYRTASDAAADKQFDFFSGKQGRQCSVPAIPG